MGDGKPTREQCNRDRHGWSLYARGWSREAVERTYPGCVSGWERAERWHRETGVMPMDPER